MMRIFTRDPRKIAAACAVTEVHTDITSPTIRYRRTHKEAGEDEYRVEEWEEQPPPPPNFEAPPRPEPERRSRKMIGPHKKKGKPIGEDDTPYQAYQRRYYQERRKDKLNVMVRCQDCGKSMKRFS